MSAHAPSLPPKTILVKDGPCDRGDREFILRRLKTYVIPQLAGELERRPKDVAQAILELANAEYELPKVVPSLAEIVAPYRQWTSAQRAPAETSPEVTP